MTQHNTTNPTMQIPAHHQPGAMCRVKVFINGVPAWADAKVERVRSGDRFAPYRLDLVAPENHYWRRNHPDNVTAQKTAA